MKRILFFIAFLSIVSAFHVFGADTVRKFVSIKESKSTVFITLSDGQYVLSAMNNQIVKVLFRPKDFTDTIYNYGSILEPSVNNITINDLNDKAIVNFGAIKAVINKSPFSIAYFYNDSLIITEEANHEVAEKNKHLNFNISTSEALYGGGARVLGMNHRGNKLQLYNRAHYGYETHSGLMNYSLPMFLSSKKYAVLFDNPAAGWLDLDSNKSNEINYQTQAGGLIYYLIAGNTWFNLVEEITNLTGRQPMPAIWTLGNFSSRFGYRNQKQVINVANQFKKDSIPLDALIIDIYWFGKEVFGNMGTLDWDPKSFPKPIEMMKSLDSLGVKTILVTEPFVLTTSKRWDEAVDKKVLGTDSLGKPFTYDFFFGNTGLIDVFKPEASEWFWNIYKNLVNQGVGGWWGDLGEPEVHPSKLKHHVGYANQIHNAYGHQWAKMVYDGYKTDFPNQRPFILMRSGFAGSQRYGMIPWTGDVSRTWGGLVPQTEISLQMGMQGLAYMHSDLGGFAGNHPIDTELYVRWLQYGVFQPIFRPHAQDTVNPEPIYQPDSIKNLAKEAIELRYRLLPYVYNMAYQNHISGKPLMIPIFFVDTTNSALLNYDDAYLWGDAFLVSPVRKAGLKEQSVYFPKTGNWYDFTSGTKYQGGQFFNIQLNFEQIPVFVKGGSFVPMMNKKILSTKQYNPYKISMHYFYDRNVQTSKYSMFIDDGLNTNSLADKKYTLIDFIATTDKSITITINPDFSGIGWEMDKFELGIIIQNLDFKPSKISFNGENLNEGSWRYSLENKSLIVDNFNLAKSTIIVIEN